MKPLQSTTQATRVCVRRYDIEQAETFSLLAEIAIAIAGFTGVVATFGGRSRDYSDVDRIRLEAIFLASGCVLAVSLSALTLASVVSVPATAYAYAGLPGAVFMIRFLYPVTPRAFAFAKDTGTTVSVQIAALGTLQGSVSLVLLLGNALLWEAIWPLFTAASIEVMWSLFLFARLLIRPN